jgi:hypothetical protein
MTLSEAIRLGTHFPQGRDLLFDFGPGGRLRVTCALGGALYAVQGQAALEHVVAYQAVRETFPIATALAAGCPVCARPIPGVDGHIRVAEVVAHLNDDHAWTRAQIADHVAAIEEGRAA